MPGDEREITDARARDGNRNPLSAIEPLRQHEDAEQHIDQRPDVIPETAVEYVVMGYGPDVDEPVDGDEKRAGREPQQNAFARNGGPQLAKL